MNAERPNFGNNRHNRAAVGSELIGPVRPGGKDKKMDKEMTITVPAELHPDTAELVRRFASSLAFKLRRAEKKYGYDNAWKTDDWEHECAEKLLEHVVKGDPMDVAAYCAFMYHHGWKTSLNVRVTP